MRLIGAKVPRVEDRRILTGRGRYVDDLHLPHMLHATFLRSPYAHARITAIDTSAAVCAPGVSAVFTGEDMQRLSKPIAVLMAGGAKVPEFYPLAIDKVRFVGDLVAMVVAETRHEAEDAAELVEVSYEPLPAGATYEAALDPASPPLFEELGDNIVHRTSMSAGDVDKAFAAADRVITRTFVQHRVANVPMETRGGVADFDPATGELTYHAATQGPQGLRMALSATLELPMERTRVLAGDVGGAFGLKGFVYREDFCLAAASRRLGRPVKWTEDRIEHLLASGHAREEKIEIEVAVRDDGTLLGMRANMTMDHGAYPGVPFAAAMFAGLVQMLLPGPYRMQAYQWDFTAVSTNKCVYVA